MYSETLLSNILALVEHEYPTGAALDTHATRPVVRVGRVIGPDVGCPASDAAVWRLAVLAGTPVPPGTRAAVHGLPSGLIALGLGSGRGTIESTGDHLAVVRAPEPGRYTGAYRLPTIQYGGLI